ncbi:MAG: hypothetical protein PHQ86_01835 [Dehalococcoidales bacterium]|nr:hypothetical protein [Dehalococcoidales bacterium]
MTTETKQLVKVRYFSETTKTLSPREYTYFTDEELTVGDVVIVPVKGTTGKAKVSATGVPESEIEKFRDAVKTIPAGSIVKPETVELPLMSAEGKNSVVIIEPVNNPQESALVNINPFGDAAVVSLVTEVNKLQEYAVNRVILNDDDVRLATDDLSTMATLKKTLAAKYREYSVPINNCLSTVRAAFDLVNKPLAEADSITRTKILSYRQEAERRRREAEEINRQKEELARREAALNEGVITVDTTPVDVPRAPATKIHTEVGSMGTMKVRKWVITDINLIPRQYMLVNESLVTQLVKKGIQEIPGIEIYEDEVLRVSAR